MAVWVVRAGRHGERQTFALEHDVVVAGWTEIGDLSRFRSREELEEAFRRAAPDAKPGKIANHTGQLWAFAKRIEVGDLVVLPLKGQDAIAIGRVTGPYKFQPDFPPDARHTRPVEWLVKDMPRGRFDQDILYSFGAFMTVCQIQRNNAEERIRAVLEGRKPSAVVSQISEAETEYEAEAAIQVDFEQQAATQIRTFIGQKFAGHRLAALVNAVLEAQGYKTLVSEPGPDGGVDIQAGRGPLGFDAPRLCVQVKSGDQQQDVKVVRELKGVMSDHGAEQGLFVAWGGFRRTVLAEARRAFFEIRLWDAGDLVAAVLQHYDQFSDDLKADLPLKRLWALVPED